MIVPSSIERRRGVRSRAPLRVAVAVLLACSTLAGPVESASAKVRSGGAFEGRDCTEVQALFLRPLADAAPFLPEGFRPHAVLPGHTELLIVITRCEAGVVNGKAVGETMFSEVGILVEEPERAQELPPLARSNWHYYQMWHLTDAIALRRMLAKVGIDGDLVRHATFQTANDVQVNASMPWDRVPYSFTTTAAIPATYFYPRPSNFWHESPTGLAVTMYGSPADEQLASGVTQLITPEDGQLAEMTGSATGIADAGTIFRYGTLEADTVLFQ